MRARLYIAIATALLLCGCTGVPAPVYCYTATASTVKAVDFSMQIAGDLYRDGKITEEQKVKLIAAHNVYRPVAQAAVDGCKAVGNQGDADKQIQNIRNAADHMLEALVKAGVIK